MSRQNFSPRALAVLAAGTLTVAAGAAVVLLPRAVRPRAAVPAPAPRADQPAPASRAHDGTLRIGLRSLARRPKLAVKLHTPGKAVDGASGRKLKSLPANRPLELAPGPDGQVRLTGQGVSVAAPDLLLAGRIVQVEGRRYPHGIRVRVSQAPEESLSLVNELDIEEYLEGVLPGEIPASFGAEAQKALAVAARSYALAQRGKHGDFDLCDRTCCQMYLGAHRGSSRAVQAVRATRGLCLWHEEELVYAFYSADCGGLSARGEDVPIRDKPQSPLPYLRIVKDGPKRGAVYCARSPYHQWVKRLTREELEAKLNSEPETTVGRLVALEVREYDDSRRIKTVRLAGKPSAPAAGQLLSYAAPLPGASAGESTEGGSVLDVTTEKEVTGWQLRRALGARFMKSTMVRIDQPEPGVYRFIGRGNGHGLGLCQIGAAGMARAGRGFRDILEHYYPGTRVAGLK